MKKTLLLLLITFYLTSSQLFADGKLSLNNGWIKPLPPVVPVRAGYGEFKNDSQQTLTVEQFSSPAFDKVELHETIMNNGMMEMREIPKLMLNPGETTMLEPGGKHLMLIDPKTEIKPGDQVVLKAQLEDGSEVTFSLIVSEAKP